jgi:cytoskeleton protein RodZ
VVPGRRNWLPVGEEGCPPPVKRLQQAEMSTVAEQLRQTREAQMLTVQQVVDVTKMRSDHVHALEQGDYTAFSAPVYIRGFVRGYAALLKLNVPEVMRQLEVELGQPGAAGATESLVPGGGSWVDRFMLGLSKVDWPKGGLVLLAVLAVAALGFTFIFQSAHRKTDPLAGEKARMYQAPTNSGERLPLPAGGANR